MSVFSHVLAGAVGGAAGGYIKDREDEERMAHQMSLLQEKQREKLELQQRDHELKLQLAELRGGQSARVGQAGSSGGGGANGADVSNSHYNYLARADQALSSGDPAQIEQAIKMIELGGGPMASAYARQVLTGKAPDRQPTSEDVLASMATDGKEYTPQPPSGGTLGQREALQGLQDFQRAFARGVGKAKDQAEAESQEMSNDIYSDVFVRTLRGGGSQIEAGRNAAIATQPAEFDKTSRTLASAAATEKKADRAAEIAEKNRTAQEIRELERQLNDIIKFKPDITESADSPAALARQERAAYLRDQIKGLRGGAGYAPASPTKAVISNDGRVATGKIGSVQSVIEKYRQQQQ